MSKHASNFKVGDIVKHTGKFLRSVGWYTNVPIDGLVVAVDDPKFPCVQWCDRDDAQRINVANIILANKPDYYE